MWKRWNQTTHVWERSTDNGQSWSPLPINAASINEGTLPAGRFPTWVDIPFNAANFTCDGGMTITISGSQVSANSYCLIGKTLHWTLSLQNFLLGGTNGNVYIALPTGLLGAISGAVGTFIITNNLASVGWKIGMVQTNRGGNTMGLIQLPNFVWTAGDNNNWACVNVTFPVL